MWSFVYQKVILLSAMFLKDIDYLSTLDYVTFLSQMQQRNGSSYLDIDWNVAACDSDFNWVI